jgi:hypothetical protein
MSQIFFHCRFSGESTQIMRRKYLANTWVQITWCAGDLLEADSRYTHHLGFGVH